MPWMFGHTWFLLLILLVIYFSPATVTSEETRECREQEYKDQLGNCRQCLQCDAGQELSKECGFGYGEDARCVPCRSSRFKEDRSRQKCKPCLDCGPINRLQKGNCSTTSNAVCGDCLSGFYRKTKLSGFQDMQCIPCGDPPPPYETHSSSRSQEGPYSGSELSCLDQQRLQDLPQRPCCQCHQGSRHICGSVHLISSLCCDEHCSLGRSRDPSPFQSQISLKEGHSIGSYEENPLANLKTHPEPCISREARETWLPMQTPFCAERFGPSEETELIEHYVVCQEKDDVDLFGLCSTTEPTQDPNTTHQDPISDNPSPQTNSKCGTQSLSTGL
ncbi:hypothetical protein DPEC_G00244920 [Dallia pectoralis]|uniref:Uncharacterized protein n=1 Tax=Dallia pectoralis TaxID=75939 RepID=A0ACC2FVU7_DALPE|nr:hypothetical protein DPEC_G00244920 [Dallia pectoralis]